MMEQTEGLTFGPIAGVLLFVSTWTFCTRQVDGVRTGNNNLIEWINGLFCIRGSGMVSAALPLSFLIKANVLLNLSLVQI